MQPWWKNPRFIGTSAYYAIKALMWTMRVKTYINPAIDSSKPYLFSFWHGKQFVPAALLKNLHHTKRCTLVSPSRDGAMLSAYLKKQGYEVLRGSSRADSVQALLGVKQKIADNYSVGTAVDGPIGPIHVVKPGFVFLAQTCNTPIIPVGTAQSSCWTFHKAWDKFELPKPFSKVSLVLGEPFVVGKDDDLTEACVQLAQCINDANQQAEALIR